MSDELSVAEALSMAVALHRGGRLAEAEVLYRKIIDLDPMHVDALHFMGVLMHQLDRSDAGLALIGDALKLDPDHADAHNNLGNMLKELGRLDEAAVAYRRVIELRPEHADAHNNLGTVLAGCGQRQQALDCYRKAIELDPRHAGACHNLGNLLKNVGRLDDAEAAYKKAIELRPDNANAYQSLCATLCAAGKTDKAKAVLREWLAYDPDNVVAQHLMTACSGEATPARAPDNYVQTLFDNMAASFDEHLGDLDYRAPEIVAEAVAGVLPPPDKQLDTLDAGCGTGLCAPFLREYARRLVGVDLSPKMIARADRRHLYDELVTAELTAFLHDHACEYDLIVSADTLVYFGELGEFARAAVSSLKPGGHLVFTVERAAPADAPDGYRLNTHGRYSHTDDYLRRSLPAAGLDIGSLDVATLRMERGRPVRGLVVCAHRG